jgi:HPr kinase/phosphorylase
MMPAAQTVHATAVLVGARAVLIRGKSGSGKTTLALRLLEAASAAQTFARLVADDRVYVEPAGGRLVARAPLAIAGMIEVRGEGIRHVPFETAAVIGWVVDLGEDQAARMPPGSETAEIEGVVLPRMAFPPCADPLPVLLAAIRAAEGRAAAG